MDRVSDDDVLRGGFVDGVGWPQRHPRRGLPSEEVRELAERLVSAYRGLNVAAARV
jgi:hypothetical protein